MGFWKKVLRLTNSSGLNKSEMSAIGSSKYTNWTKEQLIERVQKLEREANTNKNNKSIPLEVSEPKSSKKRKQPKSFNFSKYNVRFIALKFAYLGWNYNGLAVQKDVTPLPTVEGILIQALEKCKLVPSVSPSEYKFSRCGRTDKGVSAMNQVVSLNVRSNLTDEEQQDPTNDAKEIHYVHVLNQLLPDDIRVSAVCLRPREGFDARFSCRYRHYRYLFHKEGLNISDMEKGATLYIGEHDFRNFCKLDGSKQITNFCRTIMSAKIIKLSEEFYCFDLVGSAFLWHQVRCMMAILFLIGQGLEEPLLVKRMLDIKQTPQKPVYDMASDIPLILYDCNFENVEWTTTSPSDYRSIKCREVVNALALNYHMKAEISRIFKAKLSNASNGTEEFSGKHRINLGDGKGKVVRVYEKITERHVMESAQTVNEKFRQRKKAKISHGI